MELERVQDWLIDGYERRNDDEEKREYLYMVRNLRAIYRDFWTN